MRIVLGTRGSKLALAQSEWVAARLRGLGADVSLKVVRTLGDHQQSAPPDPPIGVGVFVREIEQALLGGDISLAVHSLKDVPTEQREGLEIAAIPQREDPSDALVNLQGGAAGSGLGDLADGARVGTGSLRRAAQLRAHRSDLQFVPVRGNVDTRLRKLEEGDFEALVLASAGLIRLGLTDRITERLPLDICLPAPGQGALALQIRGDDGATRALISRLDHAPSRAAVTAERAFLERLGGGCAIPVGALAQVNGGHLILRGVIADKEGKRLLRDSIEAAAADPSRAGATLAERLLAAGARDMLL